jgi:putative endonuclease
MLFFTYVAKSTIKDYYYKGHCYYFEKRIKEHNSGMTKILLPYIPVELIYHEEFLTLEEAVKSEKYFK